MTSSNARLSFKAHPTTSRAQDLVYIHNNLRLLSRNPNDDVKMWDVGGDAFDSMEDVPLQDVIVILKKLFEDDQVIDLSLLWMGKIKGVGFRFGIRPDTMSIVTECIDPTWNMNTRASSHLNSNVNNLSTICNSRLYSSVRVGNGNTIPVTSMGHGILLTLYRPLHLHNVR
ncbi:hypothetical protein Tco_0483685, partial [Tanacetum coccineum]